MKIARHLSFFLVALSVVALNAFAQNQSPKQTIQWAPTEFNVTGSQVAGTELFTVTMTWNGATSSDPNIVTLGYHLYRANEKTSDLTQFDLIATVTQPQPDRFHLPPRQDNQVASSAAGCA